MRHLFPYAQDASTQSPPAPLSTFNGTRLSIEGDPRFSDFSFALHAGEHAAIVGPNGAGKSTLLKLLSGGASLALDATKVNLFGQERWSVWDVRKQLGIVSHDLQWDYLICAEGLNVILSGFYASNDTYEHQTFDQDQIDRAREVMRELRIDQLAGRTFGHLSTGEQRRFLLGVLVHNPSVLVLDEPTSGSTSRPAFSISRPSSCADPQRGKRFFS